ncbi:MAG: primosomal replication protein N [Burkholderiales bacterium]
MPGQNRLTLDATLAQRGDLRYTPAGIPAIDCTLLHASVQAEAGGERKVECELHGVAFADVARRLARMPVGGALRCEGFLARRYRTGITVALHITHLD